MSVARPSCRGATGVLAGAAVGLLLLAACRGGSPAEPRDTTPPPPPRADRIEVGVPTGGQAVVRGEAGAVEGNAVVRLSNLDAIERTGTPVRVSASADADGSFRTSLLARVGDRLEIVAVDAAGNESDPTVVTAGPDVESLRLAATGGTGQTGVAGRRLVDLVTLQVSGGIEAEGIAGVQVLFEVVAGGGSLSREQGLTDGDGNVSVAWTLGPDEGPNEFVARLEIAPDEETVVAATAVGAPRIDSTEPEAAPPGGEVTIRGSNFSPVARHNVVRFGDEIGTVTRATRTELAVEVPAFAFEGPVVVALTGVSSNPAPFRVLEAPVEAPPLGDVDLVHLRLGDGEILLPFEDASQEYTLIFEALDTSTRTFTTRLQADGATLAESRELVGADRSRVEGETLIREAERELLLRLPPGPPTGRRLALAQELGSTREFFVVNVAGVVPRCPEDFDRVTATLRFVDDNTLIYVDDRTPRESVDDELLRDIGIDFDDRIYPTDIEAFGDVSDVDGNGKVVILLTPTVNSLTTETGGGFITGFFFGADLANFLCGNASEMFYAAVPDASATFGAVAVPEEGYDPLMRATFAHEMEHMISYNQHRLIRDGRLEALWLDEGLAHMAESLNGFERQNELRSAFFLHDPSGTSLIAGDATLALRGAAWLFVRYMVDRFGEEILARLVQTSLTSTTNVSFATEVAFGFLFHQWASALLLDGIEIGADPLFEFPSLDLRSMFDRAKEDLNDDPDRPPRITGSYLDVRSVGLPFDPSGPALSVSQSGTSPSYVRVTAARRANARVRVDGEAGSELQITVVRTK
ncbi:MAG: IPT/TIG domain-containing protein [Gemmatimonadota bacterium]|nr:IPT/TIG domain-containing protein [Gemmatimonadota bacterium]